ncbi:MAG: long-chain fatty acid--CoA ligase [Candidatus Thermoplasmatota archaeon]|mgnify:FL=1|nr:long-chain fatty acid--CoA ligase [Candidatus Thermoplasmatota archaeon]
MKGNMSKLGLTTNMLISHAEINHSQTEVISVDVKGNVEKSTWKKIGKNARKIASALVKLGLKKGDRLGTISPNNKEHLELIYAISGFGGITHTINPRLFPDEIVYIVNHAEDKILFVDTSYIAILIGHQHLFETVEHVYLVGPKKNEVAAKMNGFKFLNDLVEDGDENYSWPELNENDAAVLCYTSGTTGNPKGVLYSHKSIVIHANIVSLPDNFNLSARDCLLLVTPMFHVNAWGVTYASAMVGSKLVLPGPNLDGKSIVSLINNENITMSFAIPTIWEEVLEELDRNGEKLDNLDRILSGGTTVPEWIIKKFKNDYGVHLIHAWGMTETSPLGTANSPLRTQDNLSDNQKIEKMYSAGRPNWSVQIKIVDENGKELPRDGESEGDLLVKGPTVIDKYLHDKKSSLDKDGWFKTGDVGKIDSEGYLEITDRSKDLIKSGGEWISSLELEEIVRNHEKIHDAAVIGVEHKKWNERPLVVAEAVKGANPKEKEILNFFKDKIAKWQIPDAVVFVDELPLSSTGKPIKRDLRIRFRNYLTDEKNG